MLILMCVELWGLRALPRRCMTPLYKAAVATSTAGHPDVESHTALIPSHSIAI